MAPKKRKRVVRRKSFSLLNALESYTYASILSQGIAGTTPFGMITGEGDLANTEYYDRGLGVSSMAVTGQDKISLADIAKEPGLAISQMGKNLQANMVPMAVASLVTGVSFNFGRRLLRRPISKINANLVKPVLGAGIRI